MDIDKLVEEWFYRLPKGYADAPYSQQELAVLDEVMSEQGVSLNEFSRTSDRDEIERFIMSRPDFEDKNPRELDQLIDELEDEWDNVHDNYKNIDDYFEELEKTGGLENLIEVDQLDQAFNDAKPVKEDIQPDEAFIPRLKEILAQDAELLPAQVEIVVATYSKLSEKEKEDFQSNLRQSSMTEFMQGRWKVYEKFFAPIGEVKGLGRGELQILLSVKGSKSGGTGQKDIIMPGGLYEVKELTSDFDFDPAKDGMVTKFALTYSIQDFYRDTVDIFFERDGIVDIQTLENVVEEPSYKALKKIVDILETRFKDYTGEKIRVFREVSYKPFNNMYEGFKALNQIFTNTAIDSDMQDSRVTVKQGSDKETFWLSSDDAEKIKAASGNPDTISINVGDVIDDESRNSLIWLKRLERHPFVKDPKKMLEELQKPRDDFFYGRQPLAGLIWFYQSNPKPNLTVGADKTAFITRNVTRGNYRYALKEKQPTSKYQFMADQE